MKSRSWRRLICAALTLCVAASLSVGALGASYKGASAITASTTASGSSYSSAAGGQNALLVSGGTSTLSDITVTKSGGESSEDSDFYGTNAAILVYNGATLNLSGGTVTTNGGHANAVFAYGSGRVLLRHADGRQLCHGAHGERDERSRRHGDHRRHGL